MDKCCVCGKDMLEHTREDLHDCMSVSLDRLKEITKGVGKMYAMIRVWEHCEKIRLKEKKGDNP